MNNLIVLCVAASVGISSFGESRVTTFERPWQPLSAPTADGPSAQVLALDCAKTDQTMIGFGTCMSELSHEALGLLSEADRKAVLDEIFLPDGGALTVIRTPIGASDFSKDFYSYCETPGDFEMKTFSTDRDDAALVPLIREVQKRVPADALKIWASPWCPPRWMKANGHYASCPAPVNDLTPERRIFEGEDGFICDDAHMKAYALYFRKYVESYRAKGIPLWMVMPQNEFNSDQNFPSCTWSAGQLAKFMGRYLGPALEGSGVALYYGTMERPNANFLNAVLERPGYAKYVTGAGFQWAGKDALPRVRARHPELTFVMTEQECGDGKNDWAHAMHCWDLMRHYLSNGVSVYNYWNLALQKDGLSRWGWRQNSLVVVDGKTRTYAFTPEYYLLKHLSHFVRRGAKRLVTDGSYVETLAFANPDGSVAVMLANKAEEPTSVAVVLGGKTRCVTLPASSVSTLCLLPARALAASASACGIAPASIRR